MHNLVAFIDETGDSNLETSLEKVSTHFIVTAVIVNEEAVEKLDEQLERISKIYFGGGEIKSSSVGKNDDRRIKILFEIIKLDIKIYSCIVEKSHLVTEGFKHKKSFFKFIHTLVDKELFRVFPNLKISSDEHGHKEFMDGFVEYVKARHIPSLFEQSEFRFEPSKSVRMVQCADFLCGTLARCYDNKLKSGRACEFLAILKDKIVAIAEWPPRQLPFLPSPPSTTTIPYDSEIAELCVNLAEQYIADHDKSTIPTEIDQVNCLRFLLFHFRHIDATRYVSTDELLHNLSLGKRTASSMQYLRSKIIGPLRDKKVIISSSSQGYKIPLNKRDIHDFVEHANVRIGPLLNRVRLCRDSVKLATLGNFDVLNHPQYIYLRDFFDRHMRTEE